MEGKYFVFGGGGGKKKVVSHLTANLCQEEKKYDRNQGGAAVKLRRYLAKENIQCIFLERDFSERSEEGGLRRRMD